MINGLVVPDTGDVLLDGTPLNYDSIADTRRRMGYAVQGAGLFPHMSIFDNVTLMARLDYWSEDKVRERYDYLFALLDLDPEFSERFPNSLSGGQQQRVSLCRAMMLNPPLMLLDEPFSALDPITRRSIHEEFRHLQAAESRTVLLVTHDISEAAKLADELVILRDGEIVQQGNLQAVVDRPANDYVASLLTLRGGT
jgi:osmoprotectant transport system ATP-binding protein